MAREKSYVTEVVSLNGGRMVMLRWMASLKEGETVMLEGQWWSV